MSCHGSRTEDGGGRRRGLSAPAPTSGTQRGTDTGATTARRLRRSPDQGCPVRRRTLTTAIRARLSVDWNSGVMKTCCSGSSAGPPWPGPRPRAGRGSPGSASERNQANPLAAAGARPPRSARGPKRAGSRAASPPGRPIDRKARDREDYRAPGSPTASAGPRARARPATVGRRRSRAERDPDPVLHEEVDHAGSAPRTTPVSRSSVRSRVSAGPSVLRSDSSRAEIQLWTSAVRPSPPV